MNNKKLWIVGIGLSTFFILLGFLFIMPVAYYTMKPGQALDVRPFIQISNKKSREAGRFLLTTVSIKRATYCDYLLSKVTDHIDLIPKSQILVDGESNEDYLKRQEENMLESQQNAVVAAYNEARYPVTIHKKGVEVLGVITKNGLKQGDIIKKIDRKIVNNVDELIHFFDKKKQGDMIVVELSRNHKVLTRKLKCIPLQQKSGKKRVGVGIIPVNHLQVTTNPSVRINADDIGGPSAGLMFSLEIYNCLTSYDLTKGYRIAGTGTISKEGNVGQIGGINHKIVAADREGSYIFFCPKDLKHEDENEKVAKETAKKMKTRMIIVPVKTLKEAIEYLKKLPVNRAWIQSRLVA